MIFLWILLVFLIVAPLALVYLPNDPDEPPPLEDGW